jgi:hypothetical protein
MDQNKNWTTRNGHKSSNHGIRKRGAHLWVTMAQKIQPKDRLAKWTHGHGQLHKENNVIGDHLKTNGTFTNPKGS